MKKAAALCVTFWLFLAASCGIADAPGQTAHSRFMKGNELYAQADYCGAMRIYDELVEEGFVGAPLFYNLGNASFKCGEIGKAILFYEKARKLSPRDRDIAANLNFAEERVAEQGDSESLLGTLLSRLLFFFSRDELFLLEEVSVLLLALAAVLFIGSRRRSRRRMFRTCIYAGVILLLIFGSLLAGKTMDERNTKGIVLVERVDALSGPGADNIKVLSIPEGMKVWVDEERNEWFLIHVGTGRGGWVKKDTIGII